MAPQDRFSAKRTRTIPLSGLRRRITIMYRIFFLLLLLPLNGCSSTKTLTTEHSIRLSEAQISTLKTDSTVENYSVEIVHHYCHDTLVRSQIRQSGRIVTTKKRERERHHQGIEVQNSSESQSRRTSPCISSPKIPTSLAVGLTLAIGIVARRTSRWWRRR